MNRQQGRDCKSARRGEPGATLGGLHDCWGRSDESDPLRSANQDSDMQERPSKQDRRGKYERALRQHGISVDLRESI
jgi:hypothetical protein